MKLPYSEPYRIKTVEAIKPSTRRQRETLFYNGNPTKDLMIKAGMQIKIPKERCQQIINQIESICRERLVVSLP